MFDFHSMVELPSCPACGQRKVNEVWETQTFPFGVEECAELSVQVPVMTCAACGFSYTDDRAESLRHEEACRHQGLITPSEIRHLRTHIYEMSRKEFEGAFGVSEASLERWENRKLFPNKQASNFLRLLSDPVNGRRVISWTTRGKNLGDGLQQKARSEIDKFRSLKPTSALQARARDFRLHPRTIEQSIH